MKCNNCGADLTDSTLFCSYCGAPVKADETQPEAPAFDCTPAPDDIPAPSMIFCGHCGNQTPAGAAVCSACGLPPTTAVTSPAPKKKSKLWLWVLAAVASLLVAVVIAGLCTNWFGFYGPAAQIASAANNTFSADNFTMDIESEMEISGTTVNIDGSVKVVLDRENRDLMLHATMNAADQDIVMIIFDDYLVIKVGRQSHKQNISGELETFFDSLEKNQEPDWEELLNSIRDDLYDEVSEVIDFDVAEKCLFQYYRKLNNNKWLRENAGYSFAKKNGVKRYSFKPKSYQFLKESLECFEDAFIDEEDYDDTIDYLKDNKRQLNDFDVDLTFSVEKKQLTSVDIELEQNSGTTSIEIDFVDLGETTIDEDALRKILFTAM